MASVIFVLLYIFEMFCNLKYFKWASKNQNKYGKDEQGWLLVKELSGTNHGLESGFQLPGMSTGTLPFTLEMFIWVILLAFLSG